MDTAQQPLQPLSPQPSPVEDIPPVPPAEVPIAAPAAVEVAAEDDDEFEKHFRPSGTLLFVAVLLIGYALYWIMIYSQIIGRGG